MMRCIHRRVFPRREGLGTDPLTMAGIPPMATARADCRIKFLLCRIITLINVQISSFLGILERVFEKEGRVFFGCPRGGGV